MSSQAPSIARTLGIFAIAQVIAILLPLVMMLMGVDLGSSSNWVGSFAAAIVAAHQFVHTTKRAPTSEERRLLAWLSLATSWGISLVMIGIFAAVSGGGVLDVLKKALAAVPVGVWVVITLVVCAFYVAAFYFAYGWYARRIEKTLASKRQPG